MMENKENDKLLEQFLAPGRQEIEDNGFTRRVMRCLPDRRLQLARRWSFCCSIAALALFFALDGVTLLLNALKEIFYSWLESGMPEIDWRSLAVVAIVLMYFGCRKIVTLA